MDQLSNYELLDLLTTYGSDGASHFMNFLTVFSAFLVAGYVLAGKLGRTTLLLLSTLYIFVVVNTALGQYVSLLAAVDLGHEIAARQLALGPNMATIAELFSGTSGGLLIYISPLLQLIACMGSILFAFHTDKEARKRDE